jgi:hypothetical protein
MARRGRYSYDELEVVNGFSIDRERIGACVYWHAVRCNEEGYATASYRNLGYKRDAIAAAQNHKDA